MNDRPTAKFLLAWSIGLKKKNQIHLESVFRINYGTLQCLLGYLNILKFEEIILCNTL